MPSTTNVHNTHISAQVRRLHRALLDIVGAMNRPQGDEVLIREAGIRLDRALFPLLVGIETYGPIGVVDLADNVGRDHTTVSRQVARLEELGLAARRSGAADRRRREAVITDKGREMIAHIDAARERLLSAFFASWTPAEVETFVRLARRYADGMRRPLTDDRAP